MTEFDATRLAWCNTLLHIQKYLDDFIKSMDQEIHQRALRSFHQTTMPVVEKIIDIMAQKNYLLRIKQDITRLVQELEPRLREPMVSYFLQSIPATQIARNLGFADRSVYRILREGAKKIAPRLESIGINTFTFNKLIGRYKWIGAEYKRQMAAGKPSEQSVETPRADSSLENAC